ncbi:MAG TPA: hypothetical protein DDY88_07515 [Actinobacteria bacterium]|nr:hypothetical protein [Actinomycetota bacterium]
MLKVLNRRRARKSEVQLTDVDSRVLLRALEDIQATTATGRLTLLAVTGHRAHLYAFEGEIYAAELDGYQPQVDLRLRSGALIDSAQLLELMTMEPLSSPALRARLAAAREWVSIEQLGSIHHEFVLAAFGAALEARVVSTVFSEGTATGEVCAIPTPIDVLVEAVAIRRARIEEDWSHVHGSSFAEDCILSPVGSQLPEDCQLPEFLAIHQGFDGEKPLSRVAFECGYTLAEAVHLVSALVVRGLLEVLDSAGESTTELLTPETFPRFSGARGGDVNDEAAMVELTDQAPIDPAELSAMSEADSPDAQDVDQGRTHDVDAAFIEALREELLQAESRVQSIRAQLEQIDTVLADA